MKVVVLAAVTAIVAALAWPASALVVEDEAGAIRWQVAVREGDEVVLRYTNSIYLAPTWERFRVRSGRLQLLDVSSTREAVLEYNRLPAPYTRDGDRLVAIVSDVVLERIPLRIGERGRPVLLIRGRELPLYAAGVGAGLEVRVARRSRLVSWLRR